MTIEPPALGRRYGRRSVFVGVFALAVGLVTLAAWKMVPESAGGGFQSVVAIVALGIFMVIPIFNLVGLYFGLRALFRSGDNRLLGALGFLLNVTFPGAIIGFVYFVQRTGVATVPVAQ